MRQLAVLFVLLAGGLAAGQALAQQQVRFIWSCKDPSGRTMFTSEKADTAGKDCRVVSEERLSVVPAPAPAPAAPVGTARAGATNANTKSPAGFPKESAADRTVARSKQRETLERELVQEESMLADARRKLTEQEAIRTGDERNYAKVQERLKPYRDTVEVHAKNVEALKREISNLSR